jgi:hypothetical protein
MYWEKDTDNECALYENDGEFCAGITLQDDILAWGHTNPAITPNNLPFLLHEGLRTTWQDMGYVSVMHQYAVQFRSKPKRLEIIGGLLTVIM